MECWEDRPLTARWTKCLIQSIERPDRLWRKRCFLVGLILAEHDERSGLEVYVAPANPTSALVVGIAKDLPTTNAGIGEQRGERPIAKFLDRI